MKTARFVTVIEKSGKPEMYLALTDPAKDRSLQAAIKTQRILTVIQNAAGNAADHGFVGFERETNRQFLIFPRSVRSFAGAKIVGIKYDLLRSPEVPKKDRPPRAKNIGRRAPVASADQKLETSAESKLVPFAAETEARESHDVVLLKRQIRRAMSLLEKGKEVAAFNILKKAIEA